MGEVKDKEGCLPCRQRESMFEGSEMGARCVLEEWGAESGGVERKGGAEGEWEEVGGARLSLFPMKSGVPEGF